MRGRDAKSGFILVSTLTALALLALLIGGAALLVRSAADDARLARIRLTHDALIRAGIESAAYQLFMLKRAPADMTNQRIRLDQGVVTLSATAESGKVDLNGASIELLAALWRRTGSGGLTPEAFAARVADWRDVDDKRGPSGAEKADYAASGRENGPRNGRFETIDELQQVLGVEAAQVVELRPFLTVHNLDGKIAVLTASPAVLRLLPKVDAGMADRIVLLRRTADPSASNRITALLGDASDAIKSGMGEAFQVSISVESKTSKVQEIFIIVRSLDNGSLYYVTSLTDL